MTKVYFLFLLSLLSVGCSTTLPSQATQYFDRCEDKQAIDVLTSIEVKEKDILLFDLALLSLGVYSQNEDITIRHGTRALSNMWTLGDEKRGKASMVSSEAARDYKGEPFEKMMAGIYLGAAFFNRADYENARASFQKAVLATETKSEKVYDNSPLAYFLLAKTLNLLGQNDNAKIALEKAKKYAIALEKINVDDLPTMQTIVVVETGQAPLKYRTGPGKSLIDYKRRYSPYLGANLYVDQTLTSGTKVIEDLYVHAKENERAKKETLQATKGVVRDAATATAIIAASEADHSKNARNVAIVAGLIALANQSQADVRQWEYLPARLHITWSALELSTGRHDFALQFLTNSQIIDPVVTQSWSDDRVVNQPKIYIKRAKSCYNHS
ncbi:MAG: hypothetical protein KDD46_06945 [Bdellovibrionales bacterium]|nr:hypothetical protein [Bdellovibrionales bacterium]